MLQSTKNYILTAIDKKFQDNSGGIAIDTSWDPGEYATLEGTVVSAPVEVTSDLHRTIMRSVKNGDKIIFSYATIFDYVVQPNDDTPVYRNLLLHEGKEYWRVDAGEVFCVLQPSGEITMMTDNLLLIPQTEETGIVKAMPNINLSCNVRDVVCFEPKFVQKYNILGQEHYIIPSRRIVAKV